MYCNVSLSRQMRERTRGYYDIVSINGQTINEHWQYDPEWPWEWLDRWMSCNLLPSKKAETRIIHKHRPNSSNCIRMIKNILHGSYNLHYYTNHRISVVHGWTWSDHSPSTAWNRQEELSFYRSNNQENRNTILLEQSPRDPSTDRKTMEKYVRTRPWDRKVWKTRASADSVLDGLANYNR